MRCPQLVVFTTQLPTNATSVPIVIARSMATFESRLGDIENAPLSSQYFGELVKALPSCTLHGGTAFCLFPRASCIETVGVLGAHLSLKARHRFINGEGQHSDDGECQQHLATTCGN